MDHLARHPPSGYATGYEYKRESPRFQELLTLIKRGHHPRCPTSRSVSKTCWLKRRPGACGREAAKSGRAVRSSSTPRLPRWEVVAGGV